MLRAFRESRFGFGRFALFEGDRPLFYLEGMVTPDGEFGYGDVVGARVTSIVKGGAFGEVDAKSVFIDTKKQLTLGASYPILITNEARQDKHASAKLTDAPLKKHGIFERAELLCPLFGENIAQESQGSEARDNIDEAEHVAQQSSLALEGGGRIHIDPTRALCAIDIDTGTSGQAIGGSKQALAHKTNLLGVRAAIKQLRLQGLGGLLAFDLIGKGVDLEAVRAVILEAFGPEAPQILIAHSAPFGCLMATRPWRTRPFFDVVKSRAYRLRRALWDMAKQAETSPVARLEVIVPPELLDELRLVLAQSLDPVSPRLVLKAKQS